MQSKLYIHEHEYRASYMRAYVLLNSLIKLGKRDKMGGLPSILSLFFAMSLINSIIQEHEWLDSIYHMTLRSL